MSKTTKSPDLITVEEAASILGVGQDVINARFSNGSLSKLRASNGEVRASATQVKNLGNHLDAYKWLPGETRDEHFDRILAQWPPLTPEQQRVIDGFWHEDRDRSAGPSDFELEQRRKLAERAEALKKAQKAALAMTACDVCGVQPDQHFYAQRRGIDSHEWTPGRAERLLGGTVDSDNV